MGNVINLNSNPGLDSKADKVINAVSGHLAGLDANGNLTDSGKAVSDIIGSLDSKADKVINAVGGHLAGLDANGNLTDSGLAISGVQGLKAYMLWGNVSPTAEFAGQSISIDATDYDVFLIGFLQRGGYTAAYVIHKDLAYKANDITDYALSLRYFTRNFSIIDNILTITDCTMIELDSITGQIKNEYLVPYHLWGLR